MTVESREISRWNIQCVYSWHTEFPFATMSLPPLPNVNIPAPPQQGPVTELGTNPGQWPGPEPYIGWTPDRGVIPAMQPAQLVHGAAAAQTSSIHTIYQNPDVSDDGRRAGKYVIPATRPVIPVPVHQEIQRRDRVIEVPKTIIIDKITPKIHTREVLHEVPNLHINMREKSVVIPDMQVSEKEVEVPVPVGMSFRVEAKWDVREVPKVFPKYLGDQQTIFVEVPQVRVVDKYVETEIPVYVGEKIVKREVIQEVAYEVLEYAYKEIEEEVPVLTYKPVIDVEIDIPPPLVVPVPMPPKQKFLQGSRMTWEQFMNEKQSEAGLCCGTADIQVDASGDVHIERIGC